MNASRYLLLAALALPCAVQAQAASLTYRAIGTGKTCDEAKLEARHSARVWRDQNCPKKHTSKFSSDAGSAAASTSDPKADARPDTLINCMNAFTGNEVYIYRDVSCVAADGARPADDTKTAKPTYRAIGTGASCEDAKRAARHSARIWRHSNCPDGHTSKYASAKGFEAFDASDSKTNPSPDAHVNCMQSNAGGTGAEGEQYVYRDVTCGAAAKH